MMGQIPGIFYCIFVKMDRRPVIAVIGGGAAGCFAAANLSRMLSNAKIIVFEAGGKPLVKVGMAGGGRCNLTNTFEGVDSLAKVYPRGASIMKRALRTLSPEDTAAWFRAEGVSLKVEDGGRVFPCSDNAHEIVSVLLSALQKGGVKVWWKMRLSSISDGFQLFFTDGSYFEADSVLVATGGGSSDFLKPLGIEIVRPVPSLFSFRVEDPLLKSLSGVSAENVTLRLGKFRSDGPMLITDWGLSGPAVLKLSSYAAHHLKDCTYHDNLSINWLGHFNESDARSMLLSMAEAHPKKMAVSTPPAGIPSRVWSFLLTKSGFREDLRWAEAGSKGINRLVETLINDRYPIAGKNRFKDEFVTAGGVSLSEINLSTMESRKYPGLFFAGEALNIDAVTGGFNLQAAWSTGFAAAKAIAAKFSKSD